MMFDLGSNQDGYVDPEEIATAIADGRVSRPGAFSNRYVSSNQYGPYDTAGNAILTRIHAIFTPMNAILTALTTPQASNPSKQPRPARSSALLPRCRSPFLTRHINAI